MKVSPDQGINKASNKLHQIDLTASLGLLKNMMQMSFYGRFCNAQDLGNFGDAANFNQREEHAKLS
jgi:hypothetical protein